MTRSVAIVLSVALASLTSAAPQNALAPEGEVLEKRLATLETQVMALSLDGKDAPAELVKERSDNKFESCEHVAAAGMCDHELATMGCPQSCNSANKVKHSAVTAAKDDAPVDSVIGKKSLGIRCHFDGDCVSNFCASDHVAGYFRCTNRFGNFNELKCEGWCNGHPDPWTTNHPDSKANGLKFAKPARGDEKSCKRRYPGRKHNLWLWGEGHFANDCKADKPGKCEWSSFACASCPQCPQEFPEEYKAGYQKPICSDIQRITIGCF